MLCTPISRGRYIKSASGVIIFLVVLVGLATAHGADPHAELKQLVTQLQTNAGDTALREKIIKLALTMKPVPAVPEETERRMARGIAAFQGAQSVSDYQSAASEFEQATNAAPWYGDAYYNLGLAQDKAGNFAGALQSLQFAALASPGNREIKNLLYQVEYRRDQASAKAQKAADVARLLDSYRGSWIALRCSAARDDDYTGCNRTEYNGTNWRRVKDWYSGSGELIFYQFKFNSDDTVEIQRSIGNQSTSADTWGLYGIVSKIVGTPKGASLMDWTCHYHGDTRTNKPWFSWGGSNFTFSCDLPLDAGGNVIGVEDKRYHYIEFRRP